MPHAITPFRVHTKRMVARDPKEHHRPATTLELLFDLCFVVAIAQAAAALHHAIGHGHWAEGILGFCMVFFAIWWAWLNFTWFASSFDSDDVPYRIKVLVQIFGVLTIAAGVPRAFEGGDFSIIVVGYVVLRVAMVAHWLRAAISVPELRPAALRYAFGITAMQVLWIASCFFSGFGPWYFLLFVLGELAVPAWAERARQTPWHPGHIAERYGLLCIIVIGESALASVLAVQAGVSVDDGASMLSWNVVVSAPVILFAMWWLYFLIPGDRILDHSTLWQTIRWGYGHYVLFASAAAVGGGLAVSVDFAAETIHVAPVVAGLALGIPCALYLLSIRVLILGPGAAKPLTKRAFEIAALLIILAAFHPLYPVFCAAIFSLTVAVSVAQESATVPEMSLAEELV